jgi:hypothetical protein
VEWICADMLTKIADRSERERFVVLMKLAWNLELLLRQDAKLGIAALSTVLGDHENRAALAQSILLACAVKRERYAEDPRRIVAVRIIDGPRGEQLEVECELFSGSLEELTLN